MAELRAAEAAEPNGALVPASGAAMRMLEPVINPGELVRHAKRVSDFVAEALDEGQDKDYAIIPGTNKPSLLQPGAEKLMMGFHLMPAFDVVEAEVDHNREVIWTKPKPRTRPAKYRGQCVVCGSEVAQGEQAVVEKDDDTGKWLATCAECAKEALGGQEGHSLGLYRYVVRCRLILRETGEVVGEGVASCSTMESRYIDRPRDCENTVLQIAQKRSMVRSVRTTLGLSNKFTQDIEEQAGRGDDGDGQKRGSDSTRRNGNQQRQQRPQRDPEPLNERQLFGLLSDSEQWRSQQDGDKFERALEFSLDKGVIRPNGERHFALFGKYAEACGVAGFEPWDKLKPTTAAVAPKGNPDESPLSGDEEA